MKESRLLRFVDRYLGGPLCFAASGPCLLRDALGKRPVRLKRVVVIELFEMGAAIMAGPSLRYLKKEVPDLEVKCLTTPASREAWRVLGLIPEENIHTIEGDNLFSFALSALKQLWVLRRFSADAVIDYNLFLRFSALLSAFLTAPIRAGFYKYFMEGLGRGRIYNTWCSFNQNEHISKNLLALTKTVFETVPTLPALKSSISREEIEPTHVVVDAASKERISEKLRESWPDFRSEDPLLVVSADVGPVLPMRNYPKESFAVALVEALRFEPNLRVVLVGTEENKRSAQIIRDLVKSERCGDLCGETTFSELLALIAMARLILCNDNGIAHFAAWTRTPCVALFSTDSPYMYGPLGSCTILYSFFHCSPCIMAYNHKESRCTDNLCLKAIAPSRVAEYLKMGLRGALKPNTINNEIPYLGGLSS